MITFTQTSQKRLTPTSSERSSESAMTCWVIEDEPNWQDAFRILLGMVSNDLVVHTAHNKAATQHWLTPSPQWPDLILMDWQLADGDDGLELANEWVSLGFPAERIIIVSGADDVPSHNFATVSKPAAARHLVPEILKRIA